MKKNLLIAVALVATIGASAQVAPIGKKIPAPTQCGKMMKSADFGKLNIQKVAKVKANAPADMERFHRVEQELKGNGAQAIILGCTELSLVKRDNPLGPGFIDAMEVLAQQSLISCGSTSCGTSSPAAEISRT